MNYKCKECGYLYNEHSVISLDETDEHICLACSETDDDDEQNMTTLNFHEIVGNTY